MKNCTDFSHRIMSGKKKRVGWCSQETYRNFCWKVTEQRLWNFEERGQIVSASCVASHTLHLHTASCSLGNAIFPSQVRKKLLHTAPPTALNAKSTIPADFNLSPGFWLGSERLFCSEKGSHNASYIPWPFKSPRQLTGQNHLADLCPTATRNQN